MPRRPRRLAHPRAAAVVATTVALALGGAVPTAATTGTAADPHQAPGSRDGSGALPGAEDVALSPRPGPPGPTRPPEATLRAVQAAFARDGHARPGHGPHRDVTLLLRDLTLQLDEMAPADRAVARGYLARPTGHPEFPGEPTYGAGSNPTHRCSATVDVCVHWAQVGDHAPSPADGSDPGSVPDYVDLTLATLHDIWTAVEASGFTMPEGDGGPAGGRGPDGRLDVYLADIGDQFYGYCTTDDPTARSQVRVSAYCVLDDDYADAQFPSHTPTENLQVTAAHEFFHAVQYAYDFTEDVWLLEGTAAWVEDELYDDVDDNRQYLATSPLSDPWRPLDRSGGSYVYGNWIFWRFLTERHDETVAGGTIPRLVRDLLVAARGRTQTRPGPYSTQALTEVLADRGTRLRRVHTRFAVANRHPSRAYDEGRWYPAAPLSASRRVPAGARRAARFEQDHLTADTLRFRPGDGTGGRRWRLRVAVDTPAERFGYGAAVTVTKRDGSRATTYLRLDDRGRAREVVGFSGRRVGAVEVTVSNASVRYDCHRGYSQACEGRALDDGKPVEVVVAAFRRR